MTSNFNPSSIVKEELKTDLKSNLLNNDIGKRVIEKAHLTQEYLAIEEDYIPLSSNTKFDFVVYSTKPNSHHIIGFLVITDRHFKSKKEEILEALSLCHELYLVIDLSRSNHLFDLLEDEDLSQIGVIGRMRNHKMAISKVPEKHLINLNPHMDLFQRKNERLDQDDSIHQRYISG
ncbi:hypothetical protein [Flammeovirga agarivorans]|uniref:Uncharacterized protein n=1 Tax=Flammeovirga agarivorans TaxID=2726742 RepID=A0A7X8SL20_9BACT|nr:hypothetical protein [Flammeovirga agarivorans]NLR92201.1 hypothetical protein [Flammeovirga agarivorans]